MQAQSESTKQCSCCFFKSCHQKSMPPPNNLPALPVLVPLNNLPSRSDLPLDYPDNTHTDDNNPTRHNSTSRSSPSHPSGSCNTHSHKDRRTFRLETAVWVGIPSGRRSRGRAFGRGWCPWLLERGRYMLSRGRWGRRSRRGRGRRGWVWV